jgi:hypothetical protein
MANVRNRKACRSVFFKKDHQTLGGELPDPFDLAELVGARGAELLDAAEVE